MKAVQMSSSKHINSSRPDPGRREKFNLKFLFSNFFVVPQKVKAFIKPFEAPKEV